MVPYADDVAERPAFLAAMESFMQRTGINQTKLSTAATGERNFVQYVRLGRAPREAMRDKVRKWMSENE